MKNRVAVWLVFYAMVGGNRYGEAQVSSDGVEQHSTEQVTVATFSPESFGGAADGVTDSTDAIQQAIDRALQASGPARVQLAEGTYLLKCSSTQTYCLTLDGAGASATSLSIEGAGPANTELRIARPVVGLMKVTSARNISMQGFSVDYKVLPFSQGEIVGINADDRSIDVLIARGYPEAGLVNRCLPNPCLPATGMVFDPSLPKFKFDRPNHFRVESVRRVDDQLPGNRWRLTLADDAPMPLAEPRDRFALAIRTYDAFFFERNTNISMRDIHVFACPNPATRFSGNTGRISLDRIQVRRKPGRLLSSNGAATHMFDNLARVSITNGHFDGMGDDAINIRSSYWRVHAVVSRTIDTTTVQFEYPQGRGTVELGHTLQVFDPQESVVRGTAKVIAMNCAEGADCKKQKVTEVVLDRSIDNVKAGDKPDYLFNLDAASPHAVVSGNTFSTFKGIFRIRSRGAVFIDNTISPPSNARVYVGADISERWKEGPQLEKSDLYVDGNTVLGGGGLKVIGSAADSSSHHSGPEGLLVHPSVFNAKFYQALYPDLAGMQPGDLRDHWLNTGIGDGRRASIGFWAPNYLEAYDDLRERFEPTGYASAVRHFVERGATTQGRIGSFDGNRHVFDPAVYRRLNRGLRDYDDASLAAHWISRGVGQGRQAHLTFAVREYLSLYPETGESFAGAVRHYSLHGVREKRRGSISINDLTFNAEWYADNYPGLSALDWDGKSLGVHWVLHGIDEGRQGIARFSTRQYFANYPDLAEEFGLENWRAALEHWVKFGYAEGRKGN